MLPVRASPASTHRRMLNAPLPSAGHRVNTQATAAQDAPVASSADTLDFSAVETASDYDPRFQSPWPQNNATNAHDKPVMVYLPGIDGTGLAAFRQFPTISDDFTLSTFSVPSTDRSSFTELVQTCTEYVRHVAANSPPTRPIYLFGESFGGILALAVGIEAPEAVDRIVLVNPATSFLDSPWAEAKPLIQSLPEEAYAALPFVLAPILSNPVTMAAKKARGATSPLQAVQLIGQGMLDMLPGLSKLAEILPKDTLVWKLGLLAEGCRYIDTRYHMVPQRVFVVAGAGDWLIPSAEEAPALKALLPNCRTRVLPMRSHALLQDSDIDLAALLREEGFYTPVRRLTGNGATLRTRIPGLGTFGRPTPVELPTREEYTEDAASLDTLRAATSPVFFSTAADGSVEQGLRHLALEAGRPVLLVGNHQTFPIDLGPLVDGVYGATGVLPRGLTHPTAVPPPAKAQPRDHPRARSNAVSRMLGAEAGSLGGLRPERRRGGGGGPPQTASIDPGFLARWGAVPVGPKELVQLLKGGETVMLFPGGATEALKGTRTVDRYKLVWSPRPEFVRVAARYGAAVVPFGAVGCEESVGAIMNAQNTVRVLQSWGRLQGSSPESSAAWAEMNEKRTVRARRGVNADSRFDNELDIRFFVPRRIERFYFLFGRAIDVPPEVYRDKDRAADVYARVKAGVADCIDYLLEEREHDPFRPLLKRLAYERINGVQAPTFTPNPNKKLL
eukprot:jgi/Ulvmu1/12241/UM086_0032.1